MENLSMASLIELARQDMCRTTQRHRFKFPLPKDLTQELLLQSYTAQVAARGMSFVDDGFVKYYVAEFASWLTDPAQKNSLMLCGGCGTGKTTLALAFMSMANALSERAYKTPSFDVQRLPAEEQRQIAILSRFPRVRLYTAQEIADAARRSKEDRTDEYAAIKRTQFLIIDDLGCEPTEVKNFGTSVTPITDIIYERYASMSPTIITSNLDSSQIRTEYNPRVADRLNEICKVLGYKNDSYRR